MQRSKRRKLARQNAEASRIFAMSSKQVTKLFAARRANSGDPKHLTGCTRSLGSRWYKYMQERGMV